MLLNRLFHQLSVKLSMISSSRNWQLKVAIAALTLPVVFTPVSEAQVSQTLKAKESEAKQFVGSMNKAQQVYYAEKAGFTSSVSNLLVYLGLQVKPDAANYSYSIGMVNKAAVFNYGVSKQANLKSFVGGVFLRENTTQKILCQTNAATTTKPANPTNNNGTLACGANTIEVSQLSPTVKASEAEEREGRVYVSSMNRAQQAYYAEKGDFTNSVPNLGLGIRSETANYKYSISRENKAVFHYGVSKQGKLKSFVGGVFLIGDATTEITTVRILCQTTAASTAKPANPTNKNGTLSCGANTTQVPDRV